MRLLTTDEAAEILSIEIGRTVEGWMVEVAIKEGRLRAEKKPGRRGGYLIPEEELRRLIAGVPESGSERAPGARTAEPTLTAWDYLPERPMESFLFGGWFERRRRRQGGRR